ncbi:hypothetical protein HK099_002630, partial [Clydaea vesicula]
KMFNEKLITIWMMLATFSTSQTLCSENKEFCLFSRKFDDNVEFTFEVYQNLGWFGFGIGEVN